MNEKNWDHPESDIQLKDGKWVYKTDIARGDWVNMPADMASVMFSDLVMNKPWQDEFDEKFPNPHCLRKFEDGNQLAWEIGDDVKAFIADLIERERREAYDRGYGHGGLDMHEGNFAPLPRELKMIGK